MFVPFASLKTCMAVVSGAHLLPLFALSMEWRWWASALIVNLRSLISVHRTVLGVHIGWRIGLPVPFACGTFHADRWRIPF